MRKRLSVVATGLLAATALSIGSPAHAQPYACTSPDPVLAYICDTIGGIDPAWVRYYYNEVGEAAYGVYCKLNPPCR